MGGSTEHEVGLFGREVTRRRLIQLGLQGTVAAGAGGLLVGGGGVSAAFASSSAGKPVKGGTFNMGIVTGGSAETLNPWSPAAYPDVLRTYALFERLFEPGAPGAALVPSLALSAESNADATLWTFHLRDGVTWHDGKPFGADDVVWSIKQWANPLLYAAGQVAGLVDFKRVRKVGRLTVQVPLLTPVAEFPSIFTFYTNSIAQNGATAKSFSKPVGTGPFKFVSFTPGQQSVFVANRDYWQHPKPYVDKLVVNSSFTDETARLNALLSGQLNLLPIALPTLAKEQQTAGQVTLLQGTPSSGFMFYMRVDQGAFADVRVRQAIRLCADRPALIAGAQSGFGTVANDLLGVGAPYFADDLKRSQDIEQAKSLLKSAGREGLTVTLQTSDATPGFVEATTLFAYQAQKAGIKINIQTVPAATYYSTGYLGPNSRQFGNDNTAPLPSLTLAYLDYFSRNATYATTHWGSQPGGAAQLKLITEAFGAVKPAKAQDLWHEVQLQQFNHGGQLVYCTRDNLDLTAKNVKGFGPTPGWGLNNFHYQDGWIQS